jgi:hypothetical protein
MIRNQLRGSYFAIAQLRMLMDITPPGNHLGINLGDGLVELPLADFGRGIASHRQKQRREAQQWFGRRYHDHLQSLG